MINEIKKIVNEAKGKQNIWLDLIYLNEKTVSIIEVKTGFNLKNYLYMLDTTGIKHIFRKHGNKKIEQARGQIAVNEDDILKIIDIINDYETISYGGKTKMQLNALKYEKCISGIKYICIFEIRTGRKKLVLKTLYKQKNC